MESVITTELTSDQQNLPLPQIIFRIKDALLSEPRFPVTCVHYEGSVFGYRKFNAL